MGKAGEMQVRSDQSEGHSGKVGREVARGGVKADLKAFATLETLGCLCAPRLN